MRIPCCISDPKFLHCLDRVTSGIAEKFPDDWQRIVMRMRDIRLADFDDGTCAEVVSLYDLLPEFRSGDWYDWHNAGLDDDTPPCEILIDAAQLGLTQDRLVALIAHELGHVATLEEHLTARQFSLDGDWASEWTADWFAHRWGFGALVDAEENRVWIHHGPRRGERFEYGGTWYVLNDNWAVEEASR